MILIGIHSSIDTEKNIVFASSVNDISLTPNGSLIVLAFDAYDLDFYAQTDIPFAVQVNSIEQFLMIAATRAKYAIAYFTLAKTLQTIADHYLLDIKILAQSPKSDMEQIALAGIDGIFALTFP